ncbi:MAG: polysaccharide biosynthesis/export family protein [Phycisphaerae bacterium]|nr:polysaccharide biosynthesis/export family protein [Phycisphaerae bacterium]
MGQKTVLFGLSLFLCIYCIGCSEDTLDPRQIGGFHEIPAESIILNTLGVGDEPQNTYANAQEPTPEDVIPVDQDYVFGSGDVVRISIYELREEGRAFYEEYVVTETGKISIPDVGIVYAAGRTENELEEEIRDILSPDILINPSVKVSLFGSASQLFSIEGQGVSRPSRYTIPRFNFRLLDALAIAGGIAQFNVSYVYVTRPLTGDAGQVLGSEPGGDDYYDDTPSGTIKNDSDIGSDDGLFELISPSYSMGFVGRGDAVVTASEMMTDEEKKVLAVLEGISSEPVRNNDSDAESDPGQIEWVFKDGKYVPVSVKNTVEVAKPVKVEPAEAEPIEVKPLRKLASKDRENESSFGWDNIGEGASQSRVIKIPVDKLFGGDPQYNIVIRPGDVVRVPVDVLGEFYVIGNLNYQGPIDLTGRPMTLVQAIAAARGLNELAWPSKVEVTRRISRNKQVMVLVDLKKIAAGMQPDFFIKPNDTINVGTHVVAPFLYKLRNAFVAQYGFGFTYDRNFALANQSDRYNGF